MDLSSRMYTNINEITILTVTCSVMLCDKRMIKIATVNLDSRMRLFATFNCKIVETCLSNPRQPAHDVEECVHCALRPSLRYLEPDFEPTTQ